MTTRFLVLVVCLISAASSALPLTDAKHGFSMDVPAGYVRLSGDEIKGALHVFRRDATADAAWAVLSVQPLGLTLVEKSTEPHSVAENAAKNAAAQTGTTVTGFEYRHVRWKRFELEVMVMRGNSPQGAAAVSFSVPIPLASEAIQVQLVGPESDEKKLFTEFEGVVGSLQGETNWGKGFLNVDEGQLGEGLGAAAGTLALPGCCVLFGVLVVWLLFRKRPVKKS